MAFAKQHKEEFSDVEIIFVALETLRETSQLQVYLRGINGTQRNSSYMASFLDEKKEFDRPDICMYQFPGYI